MGQNVRIVAVGDILMWKNQISSAANGQGGYNFDPMFNSVSPVLRAADLTIGNLETTLSGRESVYQRISSKTGYPRFNCPDELAATLKRAGFNVLTTANNHCLDRGEAGLKRTLRVLDKSGLRHTGTFVSKASSNEFLIYTAKGIKIGVLSYTYGTNFNPVPSGKPWLVNRIGVNKMISDLHRIHSLSDVVIVSMHFGQEFQRMPNQRQKQLTQTLFKHGADIVLGAHPHVVQPVAVRTVTDVWGVSKKRVVAYSLGNFISDRMLRNPHADVGMVLRVGIEKSDEGTVRLRQVGYMPTWVQRIQRGKGYTFKVLLTNSYQKLDKSSPLRTQLERIHRQTLSHLRRQVR